MIVDLATLKQFPDERLSVLEHSGDVDCCVCGHKVNILVAYRLEHSAGPDAFMHGSCVQQFVSGHQANVFYHGVVKAAVENHHPAPTR